MNKMTFRDFLLEVDAGDLDWAKSLGNDRKKQRMINDNTHDLKKKKRKAKPRRMIQDTRTSL